ncbi:MAG TPA: hypothetical protein VFY26_01805 [Anaerolineales bacterium]|nr:hypothetical protein [Anaerolineales bacterium]
MSPFLKRMVHVLLVLMLFVGVSSVAAAPAAGHEVVTGTVTFSIPADQCPLLPAGVSVDGTGERKMIINTHTKADGTTEIRVNDLIKGVATDSNGGVHKFVYHNSSTETILPSGLHEISMNDVFALSGPGPHYSVTFNWRWTFTPPEPFWPPQEDSLEVLHGDPALIFACDPL